MFAAWDAGSIAGWLDRINVDRLESRLSAHATGDLEWVEALVSILDYGQKR